MSELREPPDPYLPLRLASLLDALDHGILLLDGDLRVTHANHGFVALTGIGVAPRALTGTVLPAGPASYPHAYADPVTARDRIGAAPAGGRPVRDERHVMAGTRTVAHDYTPVTADGVTVGHLWVLRDVTGQPPADGTDRGAARASTEAARRRSAFATAIAHELRTPATSIATLSDLLVDPEADDGTGTAGTVRRNAERLLALARDVVLLADLDAATAAATGTVPAGPATHDAPDIDLPGMAGRVVADLAPRVPVEASDGPPVTADPALLRLGLTAMIATIVALATDPDAAHRDADHDGADHDGADRREDGSGPRLHLRAGAAGWTVTATAGTDAPVTPERLLAVRVPREPEAGPARTGALALLLARAVAERHGGDLQVRDTEPGRFTVVMRLPAGPPSSA